VGVQVKFFETPPWGIPGKVIVNFVLPGSALLVFWQWDRLSWQARGLLLAAYGVFCLVFLVPPALRSRERHKSGAQAQGSVVGAVQETDDEGDRVYHARVRFFTPDGRAVEFTSNIGYGREPDVGAPVPVRYLLDDPQQADVDSAVTWLLPAALGSLFGLGLLVAGVVVYLRG
jgi:Protein of unknown function (DUF3592)